MANNSFLHVEAATTLRKQERDTYAPMTFLMMTQFYYYCSGLTWRTIRNS